MVKEALDLVKAAEFDEAIRKLKEAKNVLGPVEFDGALRSDVMIRWPSASAVDVESWTEVLRTDDPEGALYNLSIALWAVDELAIAIAAMRLAVSRGDTSAAITLGESELWIGEYANGEATLKRVVANNYPDADRAAGILGTHLYGTYGQVDEWVIALLQRAGAIEAEFPIELAKILNAAGRIEEALKLLRDECNNGSELAPIVMGNILIDDVHDADGAEAAYRLGISRGDAFSAYNLAALLENSGRKEESVEWLRYAAAHGDTVAKNRLDGR